ncbi:MAG: nicotinate-nucleotide adenylyltransferase [Lachnospiraceae bacterium]|nr:nicotinate-nucleotide adenylyltransferase [Lachnospiraceae bacterium]
MAKIGLLGGTFHPFHNGHLELGRYCLEKKLVSEVWFMPTGVSYLKAGQKMLPGEERLRLLQIAIQDEKNMSAIDIEIKRPGNTYTVETLKELKKMYPEHEFSYVIGADCLFSMEHWYQAEEIFQLCRLLVARRGGKSRGEMRKKAKDLKDRFGANIHLLEFQEMDISSTLIRGRIAQGETIEDLVPVKMAAEIERLGYFREEG